MPYIPPWYRVNPDPSTAGKLAYMIQVLIYRFLKHTSRDYAGYATVIGVLDSMKMELYRRVVAPYEDQKIKENGDVEW